MGFHCPWSIMAKKYEQDSLPLIGNSKHGTGTIKAGNQAYIYSCLMLYRCICGRYI